MTIDELKQEIEQKTGVPAILLSGETAEENIAQAKALLAYRRESEAQRPKSTAEQFGAWAESQLTTKDFTREVLGISAPQQTDPAAAALEDIAEQARLDAGGYPRTHDGGEVVINGDTRPAREQFADWLSGQLAFDPRKDGSGWL